MTGLSAFSSEEGVSAKRYKCVLNLYDGWLRFDYMIGGIGSADIFKKVTLLALEVGIEGVRDEVIAALAEQTVL